MGVVGLFNARSEDGKDWLLADYSLTGVCIQFHTHHMNITFKNKWQNRGRTLCIFFCISSLGTVPFGIPIFAQHQPRNSLNCNALYDHRGTPSKQKKFQF